MSKSLGNGVDPMDIIEKYGADALRFNIITGNAPGNDMRFYDEKCEAMRNFANKIWNASRFVMMNLTPGDKSLPSGLPEDLELEDKWILSKLNSLAGEINDNLDKYELGIAAAKIYDFIWDTFCDWYIELTKPRLQGEGAEKTQRVLLYVLKDILTLLHPFMPFITEEIWQALPRSDEQEPAVLMIRSFPKFDEKLSFPKEEAGFESVMAAIRAVRSRRSEMNVPPSKKSKLLIVTEKPELFEAGRAYISRLAYANELTITGRLPDESNNMVTVVTNDARLYMPLSELVDVVAERQRIDKEIAKTTADMERVELKLSNDQFTSKAQEHVVQAERDRLDKLRALLENLDESRRTLQ